MKGDKGQERSDLEAGHVAEGGNTLEGRGNPGGERRPSYRVTPKDGCTASGGEEDPEAEGTGVSRGRQLPRSATWTLSMTEAREIATARG